MKIISFLIGVLFTMLCIGIVSYVVVCNERELRCEAQRQALEYKKACNVYRVKYVECLDNINVDYWQLEDTIIDSIGNYE